MANDIKSFVYCSMFTVTLLNIILVILGISETINSNLEWYILFLYILGIAVWQVEFWRRAIKCIKTHS